MSQPADASRKGWGSVGQFEWIGFKWIGIVVFGLMLAGLAAWANLNFTGPLRTR